VDYIRQLERAGCGAVALISMGGHFCIADCALIHADAIARVAMDETPKPALSARHRPTVFPGR
jgi:hypothetical protein